jgi:hypothetical protein
LSESSNFALQIKMGWTLSVLNIENEKYFVSKNRGAAPLRKWNEDA